MPLTRAALLSVALLPVLALASASPDPVALLAQRYAQEALEQARSPRSAAGLIRLHELRDELDDLNLFAQTYGLLLWRRDTDPFTRVLARSFAADIERARGKTLKSAELLEPLGYLRKHWVLGGFENEGKSGCATDFGPEASLDLSATYSARDQEVAWRRLEVSAPDGYVDLSTALRPDAETVAYALSFLEAPRETRVELSLGTSGAFRLWVNGQLAAKSDRYGRPRPDQQKVAVRLRKGVNRVLLKVCQDTGPFGFYLRQERSPGAPVSASAVLPQRLPPLERGLGPSPVALPTLSSVFARQVELKPADARLRGEYATVLDFTRSTDEREHSETRAAQKAVALAPADVELRRLAAELERDDPNLARRHLETALAASPEEPSVRLLLARHDLDQDHPERALPRLSALVEQYPGFVAAQLLQARTFEALGEPVRAQRKVEDVFRAFPRHPHVLRQAAQNSARQDRFAEAIARYRVALALRYADTSARRALSSLLADLGRVGDAVLELQTVLKLDPYDNGSRLRLAELLAANGELPQAQELLAQAKALSPDEPEVHEKEARALLAAGRIDDALAAFDRSLKLRPQNPALKEVVRALRGETVSPATQYALEVQGLVKEADALPAEDAVLLSDLRHTRVQASGLVSHFTQLAVKVYTDRGVEAFRSLPITYSPSRQEIRVLKARVTKPDGSVVDSVGESERNINEPWTGMYYDARAKELSFPALAPGDVLELEYRLEDTALDNLLSDYWGDVASVQGTYPKLRYSYLVDMPQHRPLYWNKARLPEWVKASVEQPLAGRTLYRWSAQTVRKVVPEPSMPGWAEVATTLHVSTYRTWDEVGRYYWSLVRDQLVPNDEIRKTVDRLLVGVDRKDSLAVVRALYGFVVTNTRYVALEFGIHGYKPYRVDRVLARRFGDCKDKASLIHALLEVAGVDSKLVLLRMRHLGAIGPEPASLAAFNHAILYVPSLDLYLDGTAEFHGAHELPSSDRRADVLIIEPGGQSRFLTTPEARAEDNQSTLSLQVALSADGSARVLGQNQVQGQSAPDYRRSYQSPSTRKATLEQGWAQSFPGLSVDEVKLSDLAQLEQAVTVNYQLAVPRYAEPFLGGLRLSPFGPGRQYTQTLAPLAERRLDLVLSSPWVSRLEFTYALPAGYQASELPLDLEEKSPFGTLTLHYRQQPGQLTATAELTVSVARVTAAQYPAFRAWLGKVDHAFARRLSVHAPSGQTATR